MICTVFGDVQNLYSIWNKYSHFSVSNASIDPMFLSTSRYSFLLIKAAKFQCKDQLCHCLASSWQSYLELYPLLSSSPSTKNKNYNKKITYKYIYSFHLSPNQQRLWQGILFWGFNFFNTKNMQINIGLCSPGCFSWQWVKHAIKHCWLTTQNNHWFLI